MIIDYFFYDFPNLKNMKMDKTFFLLQNRICLEQNYDNFIIIYMEEFGEIPSLYLLFSYNTVYRTAISSPGQLKIGKANFCNAHNLCLTKESWKSLF